MKLEYVKEHISNKLKEVTSTAGKRIIEHRDEILNSISQSKAGPNTVSEDIQLLLDVYIVSEVLYIDCGREKAKPFGYSEFATFIKSICETYNIKEQDDFYARIYSVLRDNVTYEQYIAQNLFAEDIDNLYACLTGTDDAESNEVGTNNKELRNAIADKYYEVIEKSLDTIRSRYNYLTSSIFGIKTYAGVLVNSEGLCVGISDGKSKRIEPADELNEAYLPYILSNTFFNNAIQLKTDRQFNYTEIAEASKNSNEIPFYYPYKILELVSKCGLIQKDGYTFTKKTKQENYIKIPAHILGDQNKYLNHIVDYFSDSIIDYLFVSLYLECSLNAEFTNLSAKEKEDYLLEQVKTNSKYYLAAINTSLQFFVNSVTTAIIIADLDCVDIKTRTGNIVKKINNIKFMLCVPNVGITNVTYVTDLAQNKGLALQDLNNLETSLYSSTDETYQMTDLKYTVNVKVAQGLPDFAYKALDALTEQGVSLNWQNILLGKSIQDDLVTSKSGAPISLQDAQVHWIFAGSRSGKGVMCYNIFATAVASGLPIFYLDRKPDTSTVMRELAPEMFVVNGSDYKSEIDYKGTFKYSAQVETFKNVPEYFKANTSVNTWFDYAYMRGVMLTLAMLCWADMCKEAPLAQEIANEIGSPLIVLDEFTNFYNAFLKTVFHPIGWFGRALSDKGINLTYNNYVTAIQKAQDKVNKNADTTNQSALEAALAAKPDLFGTYMRGVSDGFLSIINAIQELGRAGGNLVKKMHFFVIGQELNEIGEVFVDPKETYALQASGSTTRFLKNNNVSPLLTTFNNYNHDFIIGANMKTSNIYSQPKMRDYVNLNRRFFAYKKTNQPGREIANILAGTTENGYKIFKPFLILNNGVQPPEAVLSKDIHPDIEERKSIRKGIVVPNGVSKEALLASQYVGQCLCNVEEAGLSWNDLLSANMSKTQPGVIDEGIGFEGYMQRIAVANQVSMEYIINQMNKSGQLMNKFVKQVFNYPGTWNDFIYDLDPKWIITLEGLDTTTGALPIEGRLHSSFLNPGLTLYHPEKYLTEELVSLMYLYTGEAPEMSSNSSEVKFDKEFIKSDESEEEVDEINNNQQDNTGLTLEAIQQTILSYAAKAKLAPAQWGNFVDAVVTALGLKEVK